MFKSDIIFHWSQNTKTLKQLLKLASFDFIAKVSTNKQSEMKFFSIYNMVHYLSDFWNLFLDKVYLKNEWYQFRRKNLLCLVSFRKY